MQNILIGALGTAGEVLPFIGIRGELRKRGHDVTFISNPYFEPSAREVGLSFSPVGTLEYFQKLMTDSTVFHWITANGPSATTAPLSQFFAEGSRVIAYDLISGIVQP